MVKPSYSVEVKSNIVVAKIFGDWDIETDLAYLTELDEAITQVRDTKWALFADLRGWRVSETVINFKHNNTIQLVRYNQQVECWLIDSPCQGSHIQHHIEKAGVHLKKFKIEEDAIEWLKQQGFYLTNSQLNL